MSRFPQEIERYMSSVLVTVDPTWPASEALRLMNEHEIRHLPVVTRGHVVGLVARSAVELSRGSKTARPVDIRDVMDARPFVVEPEEPADRVARGMAKRHVDCAVVAHNEKLVGLFTSTDALLAFAALLEDERVPGEEVVQSARPAPKSKAPKPTPRKRSTRRVTR